MAQDQRPPNGNPQQPNSDKDPQQPTPPQGRLGRGLMSWVLIIGALFIFLALMNNSPSGKEIKSWNDFKTLIDPDGDPGTIFDVPHIVTNSWGLRTVHGYPACDELFWSYIDALEAAGTVVIFAAGNEGDAGLRRRPLPRRASTWRHCGPAL